MYPKKYLEVARVSFRESVAYRLDAFTGLLESVVFLTVYFFVWKSVAASGQLNTGLEQVMIYLVTGQIVKNTAFVNVEEYMGRKIRKGTIVNELKRPLTLFSHAYFYQLGSIGFNFVFKSLPLALAGFYLIGMKPHDFTSGLLFLLSILLGFNLVFLFSYTTSMLIFWTKVEWAIRGARNHIQGILAGLVFPLFLLPDWIRPFFNFLPFQAMVDGPIRIFMGEASGTAALKVIANQLAWILILFILAHLSWKKARKKLTVQGG